MIDNMDRKENKSQLTGELHDNQVDAENDETFIETINDPEENVPGLNEKGIKETQEVETVESRKSARSVRSNHVVLNLEDDVTSQISDQDDYTIVNNENYEYNNDSAYETNEINSQNGSNSRIQSANTNDEDVDNETGENFLLRAQDLLEAEKIELMREDALDKLQNIEVERFENDLQNPPTPIDDDIEVNSSAENPIETGDSTATKDDNKEVHFIWLKNIYPIL